MPAQVASTLPCTVWGVAQTQGHREGLRVLSTGLPSIIVDGGRGLADSLKACHVPDRIDSLCVPAVLALVTRSIPG